MSLFTGSGVAIVTPFDNNNQIDFLTLETLLDFHLKNKTDSIIVCGTTGESSTMSDDELFETIKFVVSYVNKKIPVIAGAGSNNTSHGVKLSKNAEKAGADGCLLVTPYYNKTTQKGLIKHYEEHAKNLNIPIILYNVPGRTGLNINPSTAYELSKIDNIIGIKEASGNLDQIVELAELCHNRLDIYTGNDNQIIPSLSLGGKGVISVVANILPEETHSIVDLYLNGKIKEATDLQFKLLPVINKLFIEVNPIPVKTALKHMGYNSMNFRMPLTEMEISNENLLISELKKLNLI